MKLLSKFFVVLCAVSMIGCVTVKEGSDPLVVRAEQIAESSLTAMDSFVSWEFRNRQVLAPDVKAAADLVRELGPLYLSNVRTATKIYKGEKSKPNADQLQAAINTLNELLNEARKYYLQ
jgi:hypothetical protein